MFRHQRNNFIKGFVGKLRRRDNVLDHSEVDLPQAVNRIALFFVAAVISFAA